MYGQNIIRMNSLILNSWTRMKLVFNEIGGSSWTGGITYRKNLLLAIREHFPEVQIALLTNDYKSEYPDYDEVIPYKSGSVKLPSIVYKAVRAKLLIDLKLKSSLKGYHADVIFPSNVSAGKTPSLLWIPDFQILHLPEFFSETQVRNYPKLMRQAIKKAPLVVLSSKDAQEDFRKFAPEYLSKTRLLRFVAHIPNGVYDEDPIEELRRYNIPERFIYVPNQFWAHKNHLLLLEALHILKNQGVKPFVVFTGNPVDSRNPMHFVNILAKIAEYGLRDQIALLGFVKHKHVYTLMRQAAFVCNPSLFEGWSTPVEEAKSLGKSLLLSDLPVHIEQNPSESKYFDRFNADDLADKIKIMWEEYAPGPNWALESQARNNFKTRSKEYASKFVEIVKELNRST